MKAFNDTKTKSINRGEWFGTYKGSEWVVTTYRDGNKCWYYSEIDGKEGNQPAQKIDVAFKYIKDCIDYNEEVKETLNN